VVALTEDDIRTLAGVKGAGAPVTSCYLDVDGARRARYQDVLYSLEQLLRAARTKADGNASVAADLRRIEEHVRGGLDRSRTRGIAFFSCTADGFWKVIELPVTVRDQVVVNHSPSVRQLETVIDEYERFGVLLVDRQRARMFVFELGELVEKSEAFDAIPRDEDDDRSFSRERVADHQAEAVAAHLRHAAKVAFEVYQHAGFDRLIVSAPTDLENEVVAALHPYLRDRLEARFTIPVGAPDDEIRSAALAVEAEVERRSEAEAVTRLREAAGAGRKGVTGLDDTLKALAERRVDMLLVSAGFAAPGWRCANCVLVSRVGRACPLCEAPMESVEDVVEEAVEEALAQSCQVEVCVGNADLDVLGRIGALLRY
jgi:peptide chain release factor subunit 1